MGNVPVRGTAAPGRRTQRDALLAAAERLFAEQGVDATSLRAVMAEAGTNVAAVRYHFGSKDDLLAALIRTRSEEVGRAREDLLTALEASPEPTARGLAATLVEPVAALALSGDDTWVRLLNTIVTTRREPGWRILSETFEPQAVRLGLLLRRIRPALGPSTVRFRLAEATSLSIRVLGDLEFVRANVAHRSGPVPARAVVDDLLDAVEAVLAGPSRES
ncbi:helix-turn-helix domain-containing protein [Actinocorallia longicatena]